MTFYLTVNEISKKYRTSKSTIYQLIKTDPSFPVVNAGFCKKYLVEETRYLSWLKGRQLTPYIKPGEKLLRSFYEKRSKN